MFDESGTLFENLSPAQAVFPECNLVNAPMNFDLNGALSLNNDNPLASLEESIDKIQAQLNELGSSNCSAIVTPVANSPVNEVIENEIGSELNDEVVVVDSEFPTKRGKKRASCDSLDELAPLRRRTASLPDLNADETEDKRVTLLSQRHRSNSEPSLTTNLQLPMRLREFPKSFWEEPEQKNEEASPAPCSPPPLFKSDSGEEKAKSSPMVSLGPADIELLFSLFDNARKESTAIAPSQQIDMMIDFFLQTQCLVPSMDNAISSANPACIMTGSALSTAS
eukprot:Nk52_evm103s224 gene=Nk52_evmTU103s224